MRIEVHLSESVLSLQNRDNSNIINHESSSYEDIKTFGILDFLIALANRRERTLHIFAWLHVMTGGFIPE